jgi:hypothetical protein
MKKPRDKPKRLDRISFRDAKAMRLHAKQWLEKREGKQWGFNRPRKTK